MKKFKIINQITMFQKLVAILPSGEMRLQETAIAYLAYDGEDYRLIAAWRLGRDSVLCMAEIVPHDEFYITVGDIKYRRTFNDVPCAPYLEAVFPLYF